VRHRSPNTAPVLFVGQFLAHARNRRLMLDSLPTEVIHRIVQLLPGEDIARCLLLSKSVYRILAHDDVWQPAYIRRWHSDCAVRLLSLFPLFASGADATTQFPASDAHTYSVTTQTNSCCALATAHCVFIAVASWPSRRRRSVRILACSRSIPANAHS
jgi:F-box domain